MHGVLFDLPEVSCKAAKLMEDAGFSERCEVVGGDFFKMVPEGGNIYVLKLILHDWNDIWRRARPKSNGIPAAFC